MSVLEFIEQNLDDPVELAPFGRWKMIMFGTHQEQTREFALGSQGFLQGTALGRQ